MKKRFHLLALLAMAFMFISCDNSGDEEPQDDGTPTETKYVRKNAHSPEAQADLEAMKKAFGIMREKECTDPLSWYYQGAIHLLPDSVVGNPLCDYYQNVGDTLAINRPLKPGWHQCTHLELTLQEEYHFLIWHRFYIWHLEQVVRELSGKEDFALPYWNYLDPEQRAMPEIFWNPADPAENPLYADARWKYLNEGNPFPEVSPDSGSFNVGLQLNMAYSASFSYTEYESFNRALDDVPHGICHGSIGGTKTDQGQMVFNPIYNRVVHTGLMSDLATAGFDPIFWVHHANIDRLWEQWTRSENGALVSLDTLKKYPKTYLFFDGQGNQIEYTMEEVYEKAYALDYVYDDIPTDLPLPTSAKGTQRKKIVATFNQNELTTPLEGTRTEFTLVPFAAPEEPNPSIDNHIAFANDSTVKVTHIEAAEGEGIISKMLVGATFAEEPGGVFTVFVNLPEEYTSVEDIPEDVREKHLAGILNYFGNHCVTQNGIPTCGTNPTVRKDVLDISKLFDALELEGRSDVRVTIFKSQASDKVNISRISIVDGIYAMN